MERNRLKSQMIVRGILVPLAITGITFAAAGRIDYWQGWTYNLLNLIILGLTFIALSSKRDLIEERLRPGQGMKRWDKIYFILSSPTYFIAIIVASLDAGRFHWEPQVPPLVTIFGIIVFVLGHLIFLWAKYANRFFATVVRIQTDRGQTVC